MDIIPPQNSSYFAHRGSELALSISLALLAVLAVSLRFLSRVRSRSAIALNDWLIVGSLLMFLGILALIFWNASKGGLWVRSHDLANPSTRGNFKGKSIVSMRTRNL